MKGLTDTPETKEYRSPGYNFVFRKKDGFFARWGKTFDDDPEFSPIGPEILDLEISTHACPDGGRCKWCYKNNLSEPGENMSYATFCQILEKVGPQLTQLAFGITGVQSNPDFIPMMRRCREVGVIPNFTLTGRDLTPGLAQEIAKLAGALAVSCYDFDKNMCYDTIKTFTDLGMTQVNMHLFSCNENEAFINEVLQDRLHDPRLQKMNAIVFLGMKPKGRAKGRFHTMPPESFRRIVNFCLDNGIAFGFDSCSAPKFDDAIAGRTLTDAQRKLMQMTSESCESSLFSAYINVRGEYWNCSFSENETGITPVNVLTAEDFLRDVWFSAPVNEFRKRLLATSVGGARRCPVFPEINPPVSS